MATAFKTDFPETRSERLVVLVSPTEKRRIEAAAKDAQMSLSDFVRGAAQNYADPSAAERAIIEELLKVINDGAERTDRALAKLEATNARAAAFDEAAYKRDLEAKWTKNGEPDWPTIRAVFDKASFGA